MTTYPHNGVPAPIHHPTQVGNYRIEGVLGQGAAAVVYRAQGPDWTRVALKMQAPATGNDSRVSRAFEREMRIMARLNFPRIVRLFEMGEHDGLLYFTMELIEGETLESVLAREVKLGENPAIDITLRIASALDYVHSLSIVHRDIKPGNVLASSGGRVYLFDFGTAIDLRRDRPTPGGLYGTPGYISPEQAQGLDTLDARSDLYSLGVLLYRMVTGRKPFYGSRNEVLEAHVLQPPPQPSSFTPLSAELETLLLKALAKNPDDRFQSAQEMIVALEEARLAPVPESRPITRRILDLLRGAAATSGANT